MSGYHDGRRVEWAVVHDLANNGYDTIRAASSKGCADVVGFKQGQVVFVNCKRTTMPGPAERADLLRVAALVGGLPVVALKPVGSALPKYRRLAGVGPKQWTYWSPESSL